MSAPDKLLLVPDEFHLNHAGRCADGRSVLVAAQLAFGLIPTRDFVCTFWFDANGGLVQHRIDELGVRGEYEKDGAEKIWSARLGEVGEIEPVAFWVRPFSVKFAGFYFGLIPEQTDDGDWQVAFQPGNTMAFYAPWDTGEYDT